MTSNLRLLVMSFIIITEVCLCQNTERQVVVAIHNSEGVTDVQCTEEIDHQFSIEELPSHNFSSDTEIRICSNEITLNEVIYIKSISHLSFIGYSNATMRCPDGIAGGLRLVNVSDLVISRLTLTNCAFDTDFDTKNNIDASISIQACTSVYISHLNVIKGPGTGLALFDIDNKLDVVNSTFQGNGYDKSSGGNGVYAEMSLHSKFTSRRIAYRFANCTFSNNTANTDKDNSIKGFSRFDKGGGLCIYIRQRAQCGVEIIIEDSEISNNIAGKYGGGSFTTFHGKSTNSTVIIKRSVFAGNRALYGGAHYSGYLYTRYPTLQTPTKCSHVFESTTFRGNSATYGGGISVFSTKTAENSAENQVIFDNCTWQYNSGHYGSAIAVLPNAWNLYNQGYLPEFTFSDCTIKSNYITDCLLNHGNSLIQQNAKGSGALYCLDHMITFKQVTSFHDNNGSAMHMAACTAHFFKYSFTRFAGNTGYGGGAINLLSSIIYLQDSSVLVFENNAAQSKGGAIYHDSFNLHSYSKTCFIGYNGNGFRGKTNISVKFINNSAGDENSRTGYGHSIFATSLLPCYSRYSFRVFNLTSGIFNEIGNFSFTPNRSLEISTDVNTSIVTNSNHQGSIPIIPGKQETMNYSDLDDFKHNTQTVYRVTLQNEQNSSIRIDKAHSYILNNTLKLYGRTGNVATVTLSAISSRQFALSFRVKMQPCPPGFIHTEEAGECICSVSAKNDYVGIRRCNLTLLQAYRIRGSWIGYDHDKNESEDSLHTGYCPFGFCSHTDDLLLPSRANREELNNVVCSNSRNGVLCGQCKAGNSVRYHSLHFECKSDELCKWGVLFYILSEIVPVTIIFLIVMFFNVPFTSGSLNGFIFYTQVVEAFNIRAGDFIPFSAPIQVITRVHHFIYLTFNLNTLVLDELSFCLFKTATALDIIALNYITLLYSVILVTCILFAKTKCTSRSCRAFSGCSGSLQGGIIHGLTAVMILCYAQCTRTSILLITYTNIYDKGSQKVSTVVFYNGNIEWMSVQHLPYAIPATIFLIFVVISPLVLLIYPIHYKVLSFFKIGESNCTKVIFNPLEKMKPLLDSFQGCFKDEYRFFSSLYFLYRFAILLCVTLTQLQDVHFLLEIILLLILLLHAICQPYKKRLHNIIDALLFTNLAVMNGITLYNYSNVNSDLDMSYNIHVSSWIQAILIVTPLVVTLMYLVVKFLFCKIICKKFLLAKLETNSEEIEMSSSEHDNITYKRFE